MRIYTYVDGESHFIRTQAAFREVHGDSVDLTASVYVNNTTGSAAFPDEGKPYLRVLPAAKFFWDVNYPFAAPGRLCGAYISSAAYFTAVSGDLATYHEACLAIRKNGFFPHVIHESTQLATRRNEKRGATGLLEKAKGVDIGLAVQLLEDAYHNNFDACYVFTSDIDFLPALRVVQRMGKKVIVFGYKNGLSAQSRLAYVPDAFVDLTDHVRTAYLVANQE